MICCLNSACYNPPCPDDTQFCSNCGTPLVILRHYRPLRVLGSGGFGKTYLAEDVEKFNELCVIKQFAPQIQGTQALQKATELFEQEARRLQQLGEHPQIPTLLAYFAQNHRLYLVQQFIDGQNLLEELQQQGIFSEHQIRKLLLDLLNILKSVHQHQVIHRDIKPQNIINRRPLQTGKGQLVLIDFGASKQLSETVMNQPGTTIGSFGYAPLEQMQDGEVFPASDLYSLGATCFQLLTNITPWELWKQQGYGWVTNWRQYLQQPVSEELGGILDKLLKVNYQERYQSVETVLQDLNCLPSLPDILVTVNYPPSIPPTATYHSQQSTPNIPPTATFHHPSSPPIDALKQKGKFKKPLLLLGAVISLAVGGYGVGQISKLLLPAKTITYQKLALTNNLTGHTNWVGSLAISPDSQTLVSGSGDRSIKLWNLQTNGLKTTLSLHTDVVTAVAITPDSKTLFSSSKDGSIKIWNLANGSLKTTLTGDNNAVNSVAISPDGQTLVSGGADKTIKIWNLSTGELKNTLSGHTKPVWRVVVSPDGKTLASGSYDNTIKTWNLATGELKNTLTGHNDLIYALTISPDSQTLVSGSADKTIKIWNLATGELKNTLNWHKLAVTSVVISPDGKTLFSGSFDNTIKIWNLATGELENTLSGHTDLVYALAVSPDGQTLVSSSADKTIKIWRLQ